MRNKIIISKPYIKKCDSDVFKNAVRISANVKMINPNNNLMETKECYFEFEQKYEQYICVERSDAFVMGLLITAMENNMDIEFESPISERLYYQLVVYYIPMLSKYNYKYPLYNINLIGRFDGTPIKNIGAVATGCSGGVDSFYTISLHGSNCKYNNEKLTHLVFSSSGTSDIVEERIKNFFKKNLDYVNKIATDCNLETIACYNNLYTFYKFPYKGFITFFTTTFGSVAYVLQKLISVYYASSGAPIENFNIDISKTNGFDGSAVDIFSVLCMGTENLSFYSSGVEKNRNEKIESIADFKPCQRHLTVCGLEVSGGEAIEGHNCSMCKKCLRTMFSLYSIGKLDLYKEVFNVEKFLKHKGKYIGKIMATDHYDFTKISLINAKKNNVNIPISSYFYKYFWYIPIKNFRKILKKSLLARKVYYKLNLDYKLDGYRGANYEIYKDKINGGK